jgi:hydrogenase maturation protease
MSDVAGAILAVLAQPTCLVGMGNPWRNDDGVGAHVAERLSGHPDLPSQIEVINVEDVIESYAFDIANRTARNIVLVDAAMSPGAPVGSVMFGKVDELEAAVCDVSTHKLALRTVERVFRQAGKDTYLLGIVSADVDFGHAISAPVQAAADHLVDLICSVRTSGDV